MNIRCWLRSLARALRTIAGAPDYEAYRAHLAERHPQAVPLTRGAFVAARLRARYEGRGTGRCC